MLGLPPGGKSVKCKEFDGNNACADDTLFTELDTS